MCGSGSQRRNESRPQVIWASHPQKHHPGSSQGSEKRPRSAPRYKGEPKHRMRCQDDPFGVNKNNIKTYVLEYEQDIFLEGIMRRGIRVCLWRAAAGQGRGPLDTAYSWTRASRATSTSKKHQRGITGEISSHFGSFFSVYFFVFLNKRRSRGKRR